MNVQFIKMCYHPVQVVDFATRSCALIFDLDGVLVDSMPLHTQSWKAYLDRFGIPSDDIEIRMHGKRNDEIVRDLFSPTLTAEEVFAHGAAKEALFREMIASKLRETLVAGVLSFLQDNSSLPMGVGSNAEPANVDLVLDGAGLRPFFRAVVDGHQVKRPKPYPDIYLRVAEQLGVEPASCIVFEDSATGIEAARAAGTKVVGVATHHAPLPDVDFRINDFRDPELATWLRHQAS